LLRKPIVSKEWVWKDAGDYKIIPFVGDSDAFKELFRKYGDDKDKTTKPK
jgi:hypothetical protein